MTAFEPFSERAPRNSSLPLRMNVVREAVHELPLSDVHSYWKKAWTSHPPGVGLFLGLTRRLHDIALMETDVSVEQRLFALAWAEQLTRVVAKVFEVLDRPRAMEELKSVIGSASEVREIQNSWRSLEASQLS